MEMTLRNSVAIVTGGSRGIGKGVALGLGEAGATVYITGRTQQPGTAPLPGTIDETAEEVTRSGGIGIAVRCDHADDAQVESLIQRVQREQGRLDVLVNNALATPAGGMPMGKPFWELPISLWDELHIVGLRSHYTASRFAAPLFVAQRRGLIVNISSAGAIRYTFNVPYGVGKAGLDRLTVDMAHELKPYDVAVISLWPGLTKTEAVLAGQGPADLSRAASPQFTGRVVAALAADPGIMEKSGQAWSIFDLAEEYDVTDIDGTRPPATHPRRAATAS
jgi:dehydrogenase/reductase SDR family protein 1